MRFSIPCPYCGTRSIARALEKLSDTSWLIDFQCDNVRCGHTYRTRIELDSSGKPVTRSARRGTLSLFEDTLAAVESEVEEESKLIEDHKS